jgi:hypothetical protein
MALRFKLVSLSVISILLGLLLSLLVLESVLRCLPVSEGFKTLPVNQDNPILRFTPNRISVWSRGWNFSRVNRVRANNYGFISDSDYDPRATTPLLAIIGDSYVEAAMIPYAQTGAAILNRSLGERARVYTFGSSGSPMSQYLAYAEYVRDTFHPAGLVIVIVGNDFDESLLKYKHAPAFHYFVENNYGELVLRRIDFKPSFLGRIVQRSALGMYLLQNLQILSVRERLKDTLQSLHGRHPTYVGNTPVSADPIRVSDSKRVVDTFLHMLPSMSGLDTSRIALVVDGNRQAIYDDTPSREPVQVSYFDVMRLYLMEGAQAKGFEVIDMQQGFVDHYRHNGQRFEFPDDGHWNAIGHEVFVKAVQLSKVYQYICPKAKS